MSERRELLCEVCDWIGSPEFEIDHCPICAEPLIDITVEEDGDGE